MTQIEQMIADYLFKEETDGIIAAFYDVYRGYACSAQQKINVYYQGTLVGEYFADMIVNGHIILELKAVDCLCKEHELQLINYLKATNIEVGLLLNFGERPQIKRKVYSNDKKENLRSSV